MFKWLKLSVYRNEIFGISIISIMIFHFFEDVAKYGQGIFYPFVQLYNGILGSVGVEIFVFLSGMGLYFSFKKNSEMKQFYHKRLIRIMPTYLVWGFFFWFLKDIVLLKKGIVQFLYDYSFLSFLLEGDRSLWFIIFIIIMYFIFPFLYQLFDDTEEKRFVKLILVVLIIYFAVAQVKYFMPSVYKNIEIALLRTFSFVIGVYCAHYIYLGKECGLGGNLLIGSGLVIKAISLLLKYKGQGGILNQRIVMCLFSISLMFLVTVVLNLIEESGIQFMLKKAGKYSLELYMTHVTIRNLMNSIGLYTYELKNYVICILLSVFFSVLLQKWIRKMTSKYVCGRIY